MWVRLTNSGGPARGAPDLEDVGLDVLADAVVLERRLLGRGQDAFDALAHVEDHRPRLDPVDGAGDELALAVANWSNTASRSASRRRWRTTCLAVWAPIRPNVSPSSSSISTSSPRWASALWLRASSRVKWVSCWSSSTSDDREPGPIDADRPCRHRSGRGCPLRSRPPVGGRDGLLDRANELLAGDLLLGVELEQGADEISTHVAPSSSPSVWPGRPPKKNVGVTHVLEAAVYVRRSIHPGPWTVDAALRCRRDGCRLTAVRRSAARRSPRGCR